MKRSFTLMFLLCIITISGNLLTAQDNSDFYKYRDQFKTDNRCHTDEFIAFKKANDPNYAKSMDLLRTKVMTASAAKAKAKVAEQLIPCSAGNSIVIPVAVHYDENFDCSNVQCLIDGATNSLASLNLDFAATNADITLFNQLNAVCPTGYPLSALGDGTCISFCMATMDHPTSEGIAEGQPAITIGQYEHSSAGGTGAAPWAGYLNIFVQTGTGLLGVANAPGQANGDGVMVDAVTWGGPGVACSSGTGINTNTSFNLGRTLTHEIGHYLDLFHTFQGGCSNDDTGTFSGQVNVINDTPPTASSFSGCPNVTSFTSCADVPNSCSNTPTQFTNYMDYTNDDCMVMFSQDQSSVMNGWANGLPFKTNATACGSITSNTLAACFLTPNFNPANNSNNVICLDDGNTLTLTDLSTNGPTSWTWSAQSVSGNLAFNPIVGNNATSQNTTLTFTSPAGTSGVVDVTLTVCDNDGLCETTTHTLNISLVAGDDCPDFCDYTLELTDTFGDGWNGASLDVQENGVSIAGSPFTFANGSTSGPITIQLTDGASVEYFQTNGNYPSEEGFTVSTSAGNIVFSAASNVGSGLITTIITDCNDSPPTCTDGIQNGDEEGIDCGGSNCSECPDCNSTFVDEGGSNNNYENNESNTYTLCPENTGDAIEIEFTHVDIDVFTYGSNQTDPCGDYLTIYNGNSASSPVIGATQLCGELSGTGQTPPNAVNLLQTGDVFTSTDQSGCLTIVFTSDVSDTDDGWLANVTCINNNTCLSNLNITGVVTAGTYQADDVIISNGEINANSNGNVSFQAGANAGGTEYIELTNGFNCDGSFNFEAINIECDPTD